MVLSHFDYDHINGVKKLVGKFDINKIVIPYLSTFEKLLLLLGKNIPLNRRAMQNDIYFLAYLVDSVDSEDNNFLRRIEEGRIEVISSRSEVTSVPIYLDGELPAQIDGFYKPIWEFAYFSISPGSESEKFLLRNFKKCLKCQKLYDDIKNNNIQSIYKNRSKIKDAYKCAVREIPEANKSDVWNSSSLILYSGPPKDSCRYRSYGPYCYYGPYDYVAPARRSSCCLGWLGTGDARLEEPKNVDVLKRKLDSRNEYIHTITVPHHGSKYNWSEEFIKLFGKGGSGVYCIAAADPTYKYGHPDGDVVKDIIHHHSIFCLVSTEPSSFYKEKIKIHL